MCCQGRVASLITRMNGLRLANVSSWHEQCLSVAATRLYTTKQRSP
jgi:hypothetical protein